jgi:hypothetical protein
VYEFRDELEKKFKLYLLLFIISSLISVSLEIVDFWIGKSSGLRIVTSLLFYSLVFYFGLRRKSWAEWIIQFTVWMNIILLLLIIIATIFGL